MGNVLKNNRFLFNLSGFRDLSFNVQTASVGSINLGSTPFATRLADIFIPSNKIDFSPMTIRVLVDENLSQWLDTIKWAYDLVLINASHLDTVQEGILSILNANNVPVVEIYYHALAPISISEIDFDLTGEEETLTFDLTMTYDYYSVKNLLTGDIIEYGK